MLLHDYGDVSSYFQILVWAERSPQALGCDAITKETSYYLLSNVAFNKAANGLGLYKAIRDHWRVKTMHYRRDMILCEDALRKGKSNVSRLLSSLRTLTISLLHQLSSKNMAGQLAGFADEFAALLQFVQTKAIL